jgi:hypothetical protein
VGELREDALRRVVAHNAPRLAPIAATRANELMSILLGSMPPP